jgi:acetyl-CoA carboxylase alpha subunit
MSLSPCCYDVQATEALRITAPELVKLQVMDEIIPEPLGGAHSNPVEAFPHIKDAIMKTFGEYSKMNEREIQLDRCVVVGGGVYLEPR